MMRPVTSSNHTVSVHLIPDESSAGIEVRAALPSDLVRLARLAVVAVVLLIGNLVWMAIT